MKAVKHVTGLLIIAVLIINARGNCCDYYIMRKTNHQRPTVEGSFSFIEKYGGIYIGNDEKVIYLTFDAGYENGNIEKILDVMKKHNAKGTFFVLDNIVRRNTDLVIRMANEGHTVANHSSHHKDMTTLDFEGFTLELSSLESTYKELTGKTMSKYYRPPCGKFSEKSLSYAENAGFTTVFWSFAYADWDNNKQPDANEALRLILDNTHNGAVILLHPTSKTNADIMDALLTEWERLGYRFGSLDEIKR